MGVTLKNLKLLGHIDYKDGDEKLTERELVEKILTDPAYKEEKETIEKYIGEFIKADLITQSIHRRRGTELVHPHNDNWIDGGVYLYRTKPTGDTSGALQVDSSEYIREISGKDYVQMQYVTPEDWEELKNSNNKKIRYRYTLDEEGNIVIAKVKTVEKIEGDISNSVNSWFLNVQDWMNEKLGIGADSTEVIVEGEEHIDYKEYISKYTMPYEFLLSLCEITGSPEFVYHVAMLARQTEIDLVVQDDSTVIRDVTEVEEKYESYENESSNSTSGATKTGEQTKKKRSIVITTTSEPHLEITYANTWSWYEEFEYTTDIEVTTEENGPIKETFPLPPTLGNHREAGEQQVESPAGGVETITIPEKWYDTFLVEKISYTQTTTTVTTYNPPILANSVEKSKQFLGLLRNEDGKCYYDDCYKNPHRSEICAEKAEFVRDGTNVGYQKPNSSKDDDKPLNELLNKADMLYGILGENVEGNDSVDAEEDYPSQYKVRMQGLIDHMKYLMTLPDNEDLDLPYGREDYNPYEDEDIEYEDVEMDEDELEELYMVSQAEAGGTDASAIGHVASVVLNRAKVGGKFGGPSIHGVIHKPGQFTSVSDGNFEKQRGKITQTTKNAVDSVIANGDTTGGAFYFRRYRPGGWSDGYPQSTSEKHKSYVFLFIDSVQHVFCTDISILGELVTDPPETSSNIVQAAEVIHKYVRENGYRYAQAGVTLPNYKTKTIDCSSYVTWAILNSGYRSSRFREGMYQWNSATFRSNPEGWQEIKGIGNAKAGDILCYNGHVEIYAGSMNGNKPIVYNCGGNSSIAAKETSTSGHTTNRIVKILRLP